MVVVPFYISSSDKDLDSSQDDVVGEEAHQPDLRFFRTFYSEVGNGPTPEGQSSWRTKDGIRCGRGGRRPSRLLYVSYAFSAHFAPSKWGKGP